MFRTANLGRVWWPVELPQFADDGTTTLATVLICYRVFTRAELKARRAEVDDAIGTPLREAAAAGTEVSQWAEVQRRLDVQEEADLAELRARIVDWKRVVVDATDEPVPFSAELRDQLLELKPYFKALRAGLQEASDGARTKNSLPGPGGTPERDQAGSQTGSGMSTGGTAPA